MGYSGPFFTNNWITRCFLVLLGKEFYFQLLMWIQVIKQKKARRKFPEKDVFGQISWIVRGFHNQLTSTSAKKKSILRIFNHFRSVLDRVFCVIVQKKFHLPIFGLLQLPAYFFHKRSRKEDCSIFMESFLIFLLFFFRRKF